MPTSIFYLHQPPNFGQILDRVIFFIISETVTTFTSNLNHVLNLLREINSKVKKFDINVLLTNYDFIFIC